MSVIPILLTIDWLLWLFMAASVFYVLFFSLASILPRHRTKHSSKEASATRSETSIFLVLYPAYNEDSVIRTSVQTFLRQDYPTDHYKLAVISDHMTEATNSWLASQPITLLTPQFDKSSKARALQYAIHNCQSPLPTPHFTHVVILDADNVVSPDFLTRLNRECLAGHRAIQCHRTAKNTDSDIAVLDGLSEEINNSIFRRGHNRVGLSSALIGSGMCIDYGWFASHVDHLSTAGEDKEMEAMLLQEGIHIHYAEDIFVRDEKVCGSDNFQRQRLRWMTAQVQSLCSMLPHLPRAIAKLNIDYADKTLQQALIPRSMLLVGIPLMAMAAHATQLIANTGHAATHCTKWWLLLATLVMALYVATPRQMRTRAILTKAAALPALALRMMRNILLIRTGDTSFIHTTHGEQANAKVKPNNTSNNKKMQ